MFQYDSGFASFEASSDQILGYAGGVSRSGSSSYGVYFAFSGLLSVVCLAKNSFFVIILVT